MFAFRIVLLRDYQLIIGVNGLGCLEIEDLSPPDQFDFVFVDLFVAFGVVNVNSQDHRFSRIEHVFVEDAGELASAS